MLTFYPRKAFSAVDNVISTFASDLSTHARFNPSAVIGIPTRTGGVAYFQLEHEQRDSENDLQAWVYKPTAGTLASYPKLAGFELFVYND